MLTTLLPFTITGILLLVLLSPVAAYRLAGFFEAFARELRRHGGAMAGAYAAYRNVQRAFRRADSQEVVG